MCLPCCGKAYAPNPAHSEYVPAERRESDPRSEGSSEPSNIDLRVQEATNAAVSAPPPPARPLQSRVVRRAAAGVIHSPFLEENPKMGREAIDALVAPSIDLNALDRAAHTQLRNILKVFQLFNSLNTHPSPTYGDLVELIAACSTSPFSHNIVITKTAEFMGCDRFALVDHFREERFKERFLKAIFLELDSWASEKYELDLNELDAAIYTLLPSDEKREDIPELGKKMRHTSINRWFQAVNLTLAKKNHTPLPTERRFDPPRERPLRLAPLPPSLQRSAEKLERWFQKLNALLSCINTGSSTSKDFYIQLAAVDTVIQGFSLSLIPAFATRMKISREDAGRICMYPEYRTILLKCVRERIDQMLQIHWPDSRGQMEWIHRVFKARVTAFIAEHGRDKITEELRGEMDANPDWAETNHFHRYVPPRFYFEVFFFGLKQALQ